MNRITVFVLLILLLSTAYPQKSVYNVKTFIPETGQSTLITGKLQALIDRCSAEGGGTVYFPAGDYLTGTLFLKDNTFLELSPGATLYGSKDINDYPEHDRGRSLFYAKGASNFGIVGQGTINGNGDVFWRGKERPYNRPDRFMLFNECRDIRLDGITMLNSPSWNLELLNCDFVWIDGISMISDLDSPNSDGIDPTSSSHIYISNCYFELGDDAICPKSRGDKPTEYMVVENCIIKSDDSAIKLGTRSEAPIQHLVFNNIIIKDTRYGLAFYAKDGGTFRDIRFSNIIIESARNEDGKPDRPSGSYPIFMDIERRTPDSPMSSINDVHFSDITINSKDGHCLILGQPDQKIENLFFSNIDFNLQIHRTLEGSKKPRGTRTLTERAANDYSHIPANFTFAHVKYLKIDGLTIRDEDQSGNYERHMIWGYDVHDVLISGFENRLAVPNRELAQLVFKDASSIEISASRPTVTPAPFLRLEGGGTRDVLLLNNNLRNFDKIVDSDEAFDNNQFLELNNIK